MIRLSILFVLLSISNPNEIARINSFKKEAEKSFLSGDFEDAISRYNYLIDTLDVNEDEILLNLAHAYHQISDSANARNYYSQASMSSDRSLKSVALQQLGVMAKSPQTLQQSLQYLKASVKANPGNMDARYDYEMVKKLIDAQKQDQESQDQQNEENQEDQNQDQQNEENQQDQQNQDGEQNDQEQENKENQEQQEQDQQDQQEGEQEEQQEQESQQEQEGEEEEQQQEQSTKEKLEQMNISEEKAQMILEAMKNSEIQYIQQQKRKATERPDSGKPDW